jgi:hypothetical protein
MITEVDSFDNFEGMQEQKSNFVKFNKIGDYVKGTLVDIRQIKSMLPNKQGHKSTVFELLTQIGSFHDAETKVDESGNKQILVTEPPKTLGAGEYWIVGAKDDIDPTGKVLSPGLVNQMRNVKKGQIVGFRFTEVKPSKTAGFAPAKIIKVYVGGMDPNYMGQTSGDVEADGNF